MNAAMLVERTKHLGAGPYERVEARSSNHPRAAAFLESLQDRQDVAICECILLELYVLLRNPAVLAKPLSPAPATDVCETFRQHPRWRVIGFPPDSRDLGLVMRSWPDAA